jgi:hypothetical protein
MTGFDERSRAFSRAVADASAWMRRRNVKGHWWRSQVLTTRNPDPTRRPIFEVDVAQEIFDELKRRELLYEISQDVDGSGKPAFVMRYDQKGWDEAISDGRRVYGAWLRFKRNWATLLLGFVLGCVAGSLQDRATGLINRKVDALLGQQEGEEAQPTDSKDNAGGEGSQDFTTPPNLAAAPVG